MIYNGFYGDISVLYTYMIYISEPFIVPFCGVQRLKRDSPPTITIQDDPLPRRRDKRSPSPEHSMGKAAASTSNILYIYIYIFIYTYIYIYIFIYIYV